MIRRRRAADGAGVLGGAGWLFAELALILVVVVLGSESPTATASRPCACGPVPAPTSTSHGVAPVGLSLKSAKFIIHVAPSGAGTLTLFEQKLDARVGRNAQVGLILLFGVSRTDQPLDGSVVSRQLRSLILGARIPQLKKTIDIRPYLGSRGSDGSPGDVDVELFLLDGPS